VTLTGTPATVANVPQIMVHKLSFILFKKKTCCFVLHQRLERSPSRCEAFDVCDEFGSAGSRDFVIDSYR
jgi:hypothetical protein